MKIITVESATVNPGVAVFQLASGIDVEIHGPAEGLSLAITHTKRTFDIALSPDGLDLHVDGWKLGVLIEAASKGKIYSEILENGSTLLGHDDAK